MPGKDIHDRVCSRDEVELDVVGIARAQLAEGIDRIGDAGAIDLEATGVKRRVRGSCQHRHGVAILGVAHVLALLERRRTGRHEQHQIEIERLARLLGGDQVTVVNRVERSAHDTQAVRALRVVAERRQQSITRGHRGPPHRPRVGNPRWRALHRRHRTR